MGYWPLTLGVSKKTVGYILRHGPIRTPIGPSPPPTQAPLSRLPPVSSPTLPLSSPFYGLLWVFQNIGGDGLTGGGDPGQLFVLRVLVTR